MIIYIIYTFSLGLHLNLKFKNWMANLRKLSIFVKFSMRNVKVKSLEITWGRVF